jgi:hypothetical protein
MLKSSVPWLRAVYDPELYRPSAFLNLARHLSNFATRQNTTPLPVGLQDPRLAIQTRRPIHGCRPPGLCPLPADRPSRRGHRLDRVRGCRLLDTDHLLPTGPRSCRRRPIQISTADRVRAALCSRPTLFTTSASDISARSSPAFGTLSSGTTSAIKAWQLYSGRQTCSYWRSMASCAVRHTALGP